jgi:hypothetical protein
VNIPEKKICQDPFFYGNLPEGIFSQEDGSRLTKLQAGIKMGADSFGFFKEIHLSKYEEV